MKKIIGTSNKYLQINLTDQSWISFSISEDNRKNYLGGKGMALKIFTDLLGEKLPNLDPLGENNILIFDMGVILSTGAPCSARFDVYSKSPLTGLLLSSSCGGPFGEACKTAGWDGVIVSGKSPEPVVIHFNEDKVEFVPANDLWGLKMSETEKKLQLSVREAAVMIGPAGENLVPMANIRSGHRFAGRGGLGAVMGSKNLKAIVARGFSHQVEPIKQKQFNQAVKSLKKYIHRSAFVKQYRLYGTNANVRMGMKSGFAPNRNFQTRHDQRIEQTSGETLAEKYKIRSSSCRHCSINCGHKGHFKDGKLHQIPEYETNAMFGANIENYNPDLIIEWNDLMNEFGLDTISTGGTIAWAMEANEKGIRSSNLAFGKTDNIVQTIHDIANRTGDEKDLAQGTRCLSKKFGGEEFAMQVKGLEMAAYDPRAGWGQGLGYAVANKGGDHLSSFMIGIEVVFPFISPHSAKGKASWTIFFEDLYTAMNSLQICQFTAFGFLAEYPIPKMIPLWLLRPVVTYLPRISQFMMNWKTLCNLFYSITGIKITQNQLIEAGERINNLERMWNEKMSEVPLDDTLPQRFLTGEASVPIKKLVKAYRKGRGW